MLSITAIFTLVGSSLEGLNQRDSRLWLRCVCSDYSIVSHGWIKDSVGGSVSRAFNSFVELGVRSIPDTVQPSTINFPGKPDSSESGSMHLFGYGEQTVNRKTTALATTWKVAPGHQIRSDHVNSRQKRPLGSSAVQNHHAAGHRTIHRPTSIPASPARQRLPLYTKHNVISHLLIYNDVSLAKWSRQ